MIEELGAQDNNATSRCYTWQPEGVGLDVPLSAFDLAENKTYFYHTDANKNVTELTDCEGAVVAHYEYSPFGMVTKLSGDYAATNPFRFSSEYYDSETGLVYYNYRYYDPQLGRWLSRDPIEEEGGYNLFAILENEVINYYDQNGLISIGELIKKAFDWGNKAKKTYDKTTSAGNKAKNAIKTAGEMAAPDKPGEAIGDAMQNGADAASLCGDAAGAQRLEDAKKQSEKNREKMDENVPSYKNKADYWLNNNENRKDPNNNIWKKPPK